MKHEKMSIGWELEATHGAVFTPESIEKGRDGSVNEEGLEYKVRPHFVSDPWESIKALKELITIPRLQVNSSCGFHVHMGLSQWNQEKQKAWASWCVVLAREIEQYAFNSVPPSRQDNQYCVKWKGQDLGEGLHSRRFDSNKYGNGLRRQWLNVVEMFRDRGIKTVEVRLMGDTQRFDYLLGWITSCMFLGQCAARLIVDPTRLAYESELLAGFYNRIKLLRDNPGKDHKQHLWDMAQRAGLASYDDGRRFEKLLDVSPDPKCPQVNNTVTEHQFRVKYHSPRNGDTRHMAQKRMSGYDTIRGCLCNCCQYVRYLKAKGQAPKGIAVEGDQPSAPIPAFTIDETTLTPAAIRRAVRELNVEGSSMTLNQIDDNTIRTMPAPQPELSRSREQYEDMVRRRMRQNPDMPQQEIREMILQDWGVPPREARTRAIEDVRRWERNQQLNQARQAMANNTARFSPMEFASPEPETEGAF